MEVVQNFNKEMKGLLDHRPPVSRQKMSMITKSAIRGIKFYKHIVQSVEKFIQKCSPDYKVPGLYVMDAIIRQSRHQYGAERDVFAPRFLKNILPTFQQLLRCDEKDRPLLIRVLNLWLKNETFPGEVVQSLITLAECLDDPETTADAETRVSAAVAAHQSGAAAASGGGHHHHHHSGKRPRHHRQQQHAEVIGEEALAGNEEDQENEDSTVAGLAGAMTPPHHQQLQALQHQQAPGASMPQGGLIGSVAELLQKFQGTDDVRDQISQLQSLQDKILQQSSLLTQQQMIDPEILGQLQGLMEELTKTARLAVEREQEARRAKDVVAFDYGDSDDEEAGAAIVGAGGADAIGSGVGASVDRNFLDQLQQMTETLAQTRVLQEQLQAARLRQNLLMSSEPEMPQSGEDNLEEEELRQQPPQPVVAHEEGEIDEEAAASGRGLNSSVQHYQRHHHHHHQQQQVSGGNSAADNSTSGGSRRWSSRSPTSQQPQQQHHHQQHSSSSAAGSSSTSKRSRRRQGSSRSPERRRKERKRKSLPRLRDGRVSVVSATIFVGKLPKSITESRLKALLDEYGQVQELVLIASRGCAFVIYSKRKHAAKAVDRLHEKRLEGATLRVAWAPNKGIKDTELKEFWDEDEGCSYVPFDKFPRGEDWRNLLTGGAFIDQDSVPPELSDLLLRQPEAPASVDSAAVPLPHHHQTGPVLQQQHQHFPQLPINLMMPPPQIHPHLLMMPPPPPPPQHKQQQQPVSVASVPVPHFSAFIPPPPPPPSLPAAAPAQATGASADPDVRKKEASSAADASMAPTAAAAAASTPHRPPLPQQIRSVGPHPGTLLQRPPPMRHPSMHQQPPPPHAFFRGVGILPPPPFPPTMMRGGGGGGGGWRGGWRGGGV